MTFNIKSLEKLKDIEISAIKVEELRKAYSATSIFVFFQLSRDLTKNLIHQNKNDDWMAWIGWEGSGYWEYPPVPFDFGDIITIDMPPFYEAFHGVIVRLGDNRDCCAVA